MTAVLGSDWLTTGPYVEEFESRLAQVVREPRVTAVSSGTAALHCAFEAIRAAPGSEVITPPLTFVATQAAAIHAGLEVSFADIDSRTGCISLDGIEAAVSPRTVAVCAVDYAGHPSVTAETVQFCRDRGLILIQDAAHSLGSSWDSQPVGSFADLTTFSFFPTKNITTAEGGAVVARDDVAHTRVREFARQGLIRDRDKFRIEGEGAWHQEVHNIGLNYRLPDVLAALGVSQIERLPQFREARKLIKEEYDAAFSEYDFLVTPFQDPKTDVVWHLYPLRVPAGHRRGLYEELRGSGIRAQVNYLPAYWHPYFSDRGFKRGLCPVAENYYLEEISLPIYPTLQKWEVEVVIETVLSFFENRL